MRDLDPDKYRMVFYNLDLLLGQVRAEFDYDERKEQEREAKRQSRRR